MGLAIYDDTMTLATVGHFKFDGRFGSKEEKKFYLRNDDVARYYQNVGIYFKSLIYDADAQFGELGWSLKILYGERQPTELEWAQVASGEGLLLPDIGTTLAADTFTYHPFWLRITAPGNQNADNITGYSIIVSNIPRLVGA